MEKKDSKGALSDQEESRESDGESEAAGSDLSQVKEKGDEGECDEKEEEEQAEQADPVQVPFKRSPTQTRKRPLVRFFPFSHLPNSLSSLPIPLLLSFSPLFFDSNLLNPPKNQAWSARRKAKFKQFRMILLREMALNTLV